MFVKLSHTAFYVNNMVDRNIFKHVQNYGQNNAAILTKTILLLKRKAPFVYDWDV